MTPIISESAPAESRDAISVTIVGGGAAGLATAIFVARFLAERSDATGAPRRIVLLDGARTLGAKILVAGGSRCNVTNAHVEAADFWRGGSSFVKQVLRAFPVADTIAFFEEMGVELKQEPLGKMFPITNKSRTVLDALLREAHRLGIEIQTSVRVTGLRRGPNAWIVETSAGEISTKHVVLATGGLSLPKTGSDGVGYTLARAAGHLLVPTVPALEPLILGGDFHAALSGIAHDAAIRISRHGEKTVDVRGSLLWTHFGISGPLPLNASRFFRRAKSEGANVSMTLSFVPDLDPSAVEAHLIAAAQDRPHHNVTTEIFRAFGLIQSVALRLVTTAIGQDEPLSRLSKDKRRALVSALTAFPLNVIGGRGYNFAEVTSGGVSIDEVNPKTMESRLAPGLYFVGEILDVDGRIGGFNFQWAWSTGRVAGRAIAKASS
ncbi:MAG: NAD(P)/FAD-dependent oxidoreductase [Vicinamibacteria bacterium]